MELNRRRVAALLGCALAGLISAHAGAEKLATLRVSEAWSRPTPPGISVGVVYLSIENAGTAADRVLGASSPLAANIEFHQSTRTGGVMSMRAQSSIDCPAGSTVKASPGSLHIMLLGLRAPLLPGSSFPLTLKFRDAGSVIVKVSVQAHD